MALSPATLDTGEPIDWRRRWDAFFRTVLACTGLAALALVVRIGGWEHGSLPIHRLETAAQVILATYAFCQVGRLAVASSFRRWLRSRWLELLLALGASIVAIEFRPTLTQLQLWFPRMAVTELAFLFVALTQVPVLVHLGLRFLRLQEFFAERRVSPGAVLMATFGALIVIGTLLLKMPRATVAGISWVDALFTSTSAVCVTGLAVVDTETAFTATGRTILLMLIQVGGLGVMTLTTFLAAMFGSLSLRGRVLLQDLINEDNLGRISRTLPLLLLMTFACEAIGAVALHAAMSGSSDPRAGGWFAAVFHSVSAFCNAGFSVWSGGLYDPVVRGNIAVQSIIMVLIVVGGLGYPVMHATVAWIAGRIQRIGRRRSRRVVLSLHARVTWTMTLLLILVGTLLFWIADVGSADAGNAGSRIIGALFNSVTARTAGFNIAPIEALTPAAVLAMLFLMFIGGSPGSTAGGVKTTAFAVAVLNARRIILGRPDVELWGRRLSDETVSRAWAVMLVAVGWIFIVTILLALVETRFALSDVLFEVVSAVSTVGLTRGVTPFLGTTGKALIILTMFVGRVGVLYVVFAFVRRREGALYRLPEENVLVA